MSGLFALLRRVRAIKKNSMISAANPIPAQNLSGIVGHRFIYTYANGWGTRCT